MRRPIVTITSACLLGGALASSMLWSQQPAGPTGPPGGGPPGGGPGGFRFRPPVLENIDKNADGEIDEQEINQSAESLKQLDKNNDLQLSEDELAPQFRGGPFGPGGMMGGDRKIAAEFDKDGDGLLNKTEREAARQAAKESPNSGPFGRGPGGPGGPGGRREPASAGPKVSPADVDVYPSAPLYDTSVLRTLFLEFENPDWEQELADFHNTDVEVPATLVVDGKTYPNVGVRFRGMSSYGLVPATYKRSFNVSLDFADPDQRLYGYKTLNLLNSNGDQSFMSSVLYSHIARQYIAAPKANWMRVVINGESWGVYVNVQQFNKEFLAENYETTKGTRWKVRGSPGGGGGLEYLGENIEDYKKRYEIKSDDDEDAWTDFIRLCKTLNETPADQLEDALKPMVDIDELLWFLAVDVASCNSDGYWIRASDYSIFQDKTGVFHFVPHDMNEAFELESGFGPPGGRGPGLATAGPAGAASGPPEGGPRSGDVVVGPGEGPRGPGRGPRGGRAGGPGGFPGMPHAGPDLDPLAGLDDARKPLRSKVLAVPSLKARYLKYVRTIAEKSFDWNELGPLVAQSRALLEPHVKADTRKLGSHEEFLRLTADESAAEGEKSNLRTFFEKRRAYLIDYSPDKRPANEPSTGEGPRGPGGPAFRFGPPPFAMMEALDPDADGKLSAEEIEQSADHLKSLDDDADGKLNQEEIGWPPFGRGFGPPGGGFPGGGPAGPPGADAERRRPPRDEDAN